MNIYTKTGDKGQTSLANGKRVSKTDLRLECYGTADELNSWVGLLRARLHEPSYDEWMNYFQNRLFNLGAMLAGAEGADWITADDVAQVEHWIDLMQSQLEPLRAFILPGGSESIATSHLCRTVTRRLERLMVALSDAQRSDSFDTATQPETMAIALQWINRLSDFFFVLARTLTQKENISPLVWKK